MLISSNSTGYSVDLERRLAVSEVWRQEASGNGMILQRPFSFGKGWYLCILGLFLGGGMMYYAFSESSIAFGIFGLLGCIASLAPAFGQKVRFDQTMHRIDIWNTFFGIFAWKKRVIFSDVSGVELMVQCTDQSVDSAQRRRDSHIREADAFAVSIQCSEGARISVWESEHYCEAMEIAKTLSEFHRCRFAESVNGVEGRWKLEDIDDFQSKYRDGSIPIALGASQ